jgi:hypothetical protein
LKHGRVAVQAPDSGEDQASGSQVQTVLKLRRRAGGELSFFPILSPTGCAQPLRKEADERAHDEAGHHDLEVRMPAIHRIRGSHKKSE